MALVFIGLGSNLGEGSKNLKQAWKEISDHSQVTVLSISSPFHTEPMGILSQNWFTNAVGALETSLEPIELLSVLLEIESKMGRDRGQGEDRIIDLDILYYDDLVLNDPELELPHPEIMKRLFVLAPLEELAPDHVHPVLQQTTRSMKNSLRADYRVNKSTW